MYGLLVQERATTRNEALYRSLLSFAQKLERSVSTLTLFAPRVIFATPIAIAYCRFRSRHPLLYFACMRYLQPPSRQSGYGTSTLSSLLLQFGGARRLQAPSGGPSINLR